MVGWQCNSYTLPTLNVAHIVTLKLVCTGMSSTATWDRHFVDAVRKCFVPISCSFATLHDVGAAEMHRACTAPRFSLISSCRLLKCIGCLTLAALNEQRCRQNGSTVTQILDHPIQRLQLLLDLQELSSYMRVQLIIHRRQVWTTTKRSTVAIL
eukprot:COSAG02_NODE_218_length_28570_cov_75.594816_3_plen_154_part_00